MYKLRMPKGIVVWTDYLCQSMSFEPKPLCNMSRYPEMIIYKC